MSDSYKVQQINLMLKDIQEDEYALARLKSDHSKAINIDEGALHILMDYYSGNITASIKTSAKYVKAYSYEDEGSELDLYDMIDYIDANWDNLGCGEKMSRKEAEYYLGHSVSGMSKEEVDQEVSELQKAYYVDGEASDEEIVDMYNCMIAAK